MTSPWSGSCPSTGRFFFINGPAGPPRLFSSARPPESGPGALPAAFRFRGHDRILRGAILVALFGTLLFTLQYEPAAFIFPWHTAGMTVLQGAVFLLALPHARFPSGRLPLLFPGLWGALLLWVVISVFWSIAPAITLQQALLVFLTPGLILLLVYCDSAPMTTFWGFARGMTWFGTFLAAVGLFLFLAGETIVLNQWEGVQVIQWGPLRLAQAVHFLAGWPRIASLTGDPNTLALWLAFSLPCTGLLYISRRLSLVNFLILGLIQKFALTLTLSRAGAGMALLALALAYLFLGRGAGGKFARAGALFTVLVAALLFVHEYLLLYPGGGGPLVFLDGSLGLRGDAWTLVHRVFLQHPFTGTGFGTSGILLQEAGVNLLHLHNVYLSLLGESGLFGLVLFLFFWLGALVFATWKWIRLSTASLYPRWVCSGKTDGADSGPAARAEVTRSVPGSAFVALVGVIVLLLSLLLHQFFETMLLRTNFHTLLWLYLVGVASHPRMVD